MADILENDLVKQYPLGICQRHTSAKIDIDGEAHCMRCDAEAAKAQARPYGVNRIADPGAEAMKDLKTAEKEAFDVQVEEAPARPGPAPVRRAAPSDQTRPLTFDECIAEAVRQLRAAPMPKDLKQFKAVQKAIQGLEKVTTGEA